MPKDILLSIGLDVIRSYKRLAYTPWHALAEFVDNSTQCFFDHREILTEAYTRENCVLSVKIDYDRNAKRIKIRDNALGMSLDDLKSAVHVGKPPKNTSGRSQFGLGLKTAACWLGNKWMVRTTKLGEVGGHMITVDVERVANGDQHLPLETFEAPAEEHFTEIIIEDLNHVLKGRKLGTTKKFLKSMYRVDTREGQLRLLWNDELLNWDQGYKYLPDADGNYTRDIDFTVNGKRVWGWAGVLAPGYSGRGEAGFAIIRRGRVIRGWPQAWKPEEIFGDYGGRNDLVNQRITGEFHFDKFEVTHTKDDILWQDQEPSAPGLEPSSEEDLVQDEIATRITDLIEIARTTRSKAPPVTNRTVAFKLALQDAGVEARASGINTAVKAFLKAAPKPEALQSAMIGRLEKLKKETPVFDCPLNQKSSLKAVISEAFGEDVAYAVTTELGKEHAFVGINSAHPLCDPEESASMVMHFQHSLSDLIVLWTLLHRKLDFDPILWLALKDVVLRQFASETST